MLRAVRELLANIVKHGRAAVVTIEIRGGPQILTIAIDDDGVGFDPKNTPPLDLPRGFGLFSVKEGMRFIGGDVDIASEIGAGTRVTLSVPLDGAVLPGVQNS